MGEICEMCIWLTFAIVFLRVMMLDRRREMYEYVEGIWPKKQFISLSST